ncbi:TPA: hypothetical protein DDZ10_02755 [Candidatus Uhrbacteria bacterium]|uniref:Uncharacterized protein n=1 Tax=Candidatus Uhrbacteria bacterium GW2011_GWC2_53_7 TaxID=1618986 RepID=A0A0G2A678_9BACT|nr:MAG: hypothetical protein UY82_C0025G0008 [Candidatus Uhrbacteria bacterium GW2011_GWC2_53_7]OGL72842.1 MAG: hypothetical protein A3D69_01040 [Candidatus Uhrbacteria bacterium RIFCSPHIGHO2_02_FULL_54_11]HBL39569.1 hypothetical protein [Candidatus Uhrbacteria bacterium]
MQVSQCVVPGEGVFLLLCNAPMCEMRSKVVEVGRQLPNHTKRILHFNVEVRILLVFFRTN